MIMKIENALGLVEEVKNCSLPWDDAHWEALGMVINYVKNKLNEDFQTTWRPSNGQMEALDLEKELDSMITPELKFHKALPSLFDVAKHFFELGMQVGNKA
jgi:hypothetical protein